MYAGFITPKRVVKKAGIHQRLDMAAYKMIAHYLPDEAFPSLKAILSFEGYNGPDGLKSKLGLHPKGSRPEDKDSHEPSHLYDPVTDTGEVPMHIDNHYRGLVDCLVAGEYGPGVVRGRLAGSLYWRRAHARPSFPARR